ncbi:LacI family DNA-binding transcriptional regulator [Micromonospora echinofusca]|uniref:Substrate-binding domain-containing protein n=1 Tax=Micromonospora echinofusca TaxID=47858 RepID=A0ABS3VQW8_MICEH|nr:LacI family DNA-binding transcriptional regulator [Micromonospora echinofusca]MBO4206933.1 substrate-binding domain-containing protein [Micromonospora echinofusca]
MTPPAPRRVTQRDIARLAGVSQATVSLVLNNRSDADVRIAPETRRRVLRAIDETGYVADPVARRLVSRFNRIIGVFTYEPAFPSGSRDFFHPFLLGIEEYAERVGCDLLLFTSAPVVDGRRKVFHQDNRLRLADGCILLGREIDGTELRRLNEDGFPYVAVGRRDDAGGPVPYVGADYATAVGQLVEFALARGHRRLAYLSMGLTAESSTDRQHGFARSTRAAESARQFATTGQDADLLLDNLRADRTTVALVEDFGTAVALELAARRRGLSVPGDLSIVTLGDPTVPVPSDITFTGFHIPREEMGRQAVEVLTTVVDGSATDVPQRLLPCVLVEGETLGAPDPAVDRN